MGRVGRASEAAATVAAQDTGHRVVFMRGHDIKLPGAGEVAPSSTETLPSGLRGKGGPAGGAADVHALRQFGYTRRRHVVFGGQVEAIDDADLAAISDHRNSSFVFHA